MVILRKEQNVKKCLPHTDSRWWRPGRAEGVNEGKKGTYVLFNNKVLKKKEEMPTPVIPWWQRLYLQGLKVSSPHKITTN